MSKVKVFYFSTKNKGLGDMKRLSLALATLLVFGCQCLALDAVVTSVRKYRQANEWQFLRDYLEFLSIPNVASDRENIRRNADFLVAEMQKRGLKPRLLTTADAAAPPSVYGEWTAPGATRTVVFYAHYDGQPTDPGQWTGSLPWQPVLRSAALEKGGRILPVPRSNEAINPEWRIYGRSASDDKSGVFAILRALDALRANNIQPTVNLKFFFEGEEEASSPHLKEIISRHKELLKADAWIICDGPVHQSGRKQVVFGVRGVTLGRSDRLRGEPPPAQRSLRQLVAEPGADARAAFVFDEGRRWKRPRQKLAR
jgi:acetylornithine deacetylase/succinyl-diaminopimelate desuccinylase-like protein